MRQGAQGWCTGMTQRDGMERVRMGDTRTPVADSCECMAKPPQYCKVISLQLKFKIKKKKRRWPSLMKVAASSLLRA